MCGAEERKIHLERTRWELREERCSKAVNLICVRGLFQLLPPPRNHLASSVVAFVCLSFRFLTRIRYSCVPDAQSCRLQRPLE
jgi:hypothetical protein